MDLRWVPTVVLVGCFSEPDGNNASSGPEPTSSSSGTSGGASTTTVANTGESSESSESAASDTTERAPTCDVGTCVVPPAPWAGPIDVVTASLDDPRPTCAPEEDERWFSGRDTVAVCDCSMCSDAPEPCSTSVVWGTFGSCNVGATSLAGCQPLDTDAAGQLSLVVEVDEGDGPTCRPPMPSGPVFQQRAVGCQRAGESCDVDGLCVEGPACIWREGEHGCPDGFSQRRVFFDDAVGGGGSCDSCGCGEDNGLFCDRAEIRLHGQIDCSDEPLEAPDEFQSSPSCEFYSSFVLIEDVLAIDIRPALPDCSSDLSVAFAAGGSYGQQTPRTVCCTP